MNDPLTINMEEDEALKIYLPSMPSWNDFDELIKFLVREYNAVVLIEADGPEGSRRRVLESDGFQFELCHDDVGGNVLLSEAVASRVFVSVIGKDLEERLTGKTLSIGNTIEARIITNGENATLTFWTPHYDVTGKIYKTLEDRSYFKHLVLGGAPFAYALIYTPTKYSDKLLNDLKMMDKNAMLMDESLPEGEMPDEFWMNIIEKMGQADPIVNKSQGLPRNPISRRP